MRALTNAHPASSYWWDLIFSLLICGLTWSPASHKRRCRVVAVWWDVLRPVVRIPAAAINTALIWGGLMGFLFFCLLQFSLFCSFAFVTWRKIPPTLIFVVSSAVLSNNSPSFVWSCHLALSLCTNASLLFYHWDLMFFNKTFSLWNISI